MTKKISATLQEATRGEKLTADTVNALIRLAKAQGYMREGTVDEDGAAARGLSRATPRWLPSLPAPDNIPAYSVFAITGQGFPAWDEPMPVKISQVGAGAATAFGNPGVLATNGSVAVVTGQTLMVQPLSYWEPVKVKVTGSTPKVGEFCGLDHDKWGITTGRFGLVCTAPAKSGVVEVIRTDQPHGAIGITSGTVTGWTGGSKIGSGFVELWYRKDDNSIHQAWDPSLATKPFKLPVYNLCYDAIPGGTFVQLHDVMGVGLVAIPCACACDSSSSASSGSESGSPTPPGSGCEGSFDFINGLVANGCGLTISWQRATYVNGCLDITDLDDTDLLLSDCGSGGGGSGGSTIDDGCVTWVWCDGAWTTSATEPGNPPPVDGRFNGEAVVVCDCAAVSSSVSASESESDSCSDGNCLAMVVRWASTTARYEAEPAGMRNGKPYWQFSPTGNYPLNNGSTWYLYWCESTTGAAFGGEPHWICSQTLGACDQDEWGGNWISSSDLHNNEGCDPLNYGDPDPESNWSATLISGDDVWFEPCVSVSSSVSSSSSSSSSGSCQSPECVTLNWQAAGQPEATVVTASAPSGTTNGQPYWTFTDAALPSGELYLYWCPDFDDGNRVGPTWILSEISGECDYMSLFSKYAYSPENKTDCDPTGFVFFGVGTWATTFVKFTECESSASSGSSSASSEGTSCEEMCVEIDFNGEFPLVQGTIGSELVNGQYYWHFDLVGYPDVYIWWCPDWNSTGSPKWVAANVIAAGCTPGAIGTSGYSLLDPINDSPCGGPLGTSIEWVEYSDWASQPYYMSTQEC